MNLFTKISNLFETRRPIFKTIIGTVAVIGCSIGVAAITSNPSSDINKNTNDAVISDTTTPTGDTVVFKNMQFDVVEETSTTTKVDATTAGTTTSSKSTTSTTAVTNTSTASTSLAKPKPAPASVVTPTVDGIVTTTSEVNNDTIDITTTEEIVVTTIESTTASESITTTVAEVVENNGEYIVYKPSTHYVHRSTCHWFNDECYAITSTEGLECRICTECNPDITVVTPYVEPTPAANVVNASGHAALNYVTEEERIYLCNTVAQEYGSDWVSLYDKACVVATVMNRVHDGGWTNGLPSTVYNVLTAPYQYNPAYAVPYYRWNVTQSVIDSVDYYFENQDMFPHYTSFQGDGTYNYFR